MTRLKSILRYVGRGFAGAGLIMVLAGISVFAPSPAHALDSFNSDAISRLDGIIWRHDAQTKPGIDNLTNLIQQAKQQATESNQNSWNVRLQNADMSAKVDKIVKAATDANSNSHIAATNAVSNATALGELKSRLKEANANAFQAAKDAASIKTGVNGLETSLGAVRSVADSVKSAVDAMRKVGATSQHVRAIQADIDALEAAQAANHAELTRQVAELAGVVAGLSADGAGNGSGELLSISRTIGNLLDRLLGDGCNPDIAVAAVKSSTLCGPTRDQLRDLGDRLHDDVQELRSALNDRMNEQQSRDEAFVRQVQELQERVGQGLSGLQSKLGEVASAAREAAESAAETAARAVQEAARVTAEGLEAVKGKLDGVLGGLSGLASKVDGLGRGPSGEVGSAAPSMPRLNAWAEQARCFQAALRGAEGASCQGGMRLPLGGGIEVDPLAKACEVIPADKFNLLRTIVAAIVIIAAYFAAWRAVMAGFSHDTQAVKVNA